jgi:hypothetical protein
MGKKDSAVLLLNYILRTIASYGGASDKLGCYDEDPKLDFLIQIDKLLHGNEVHLKGGHELAFVLLE